MNYGLATIVNANGSMEELDRDAVWMLSDDFSDSDLIEALSTLHANKVHRRNLGEKARQVIAEQHDPVRCAKKYFKSIEDYNRRARVGLTGALEAVAEYACDMDLSDWPELASDIAKNLVPSPRCRQLLVDISELVQKDGRSGIQRVVRSVLNHLLRNPPKDWHVEPVYATSDEEGYRYARRFSCDFLSIPQDWITDDVVDTFPGDVFLGLDFQPQIVPKQIEVLKEWHRRGVAVQFLVYDLLPLLRPHFFVDGAKEGFLPWLEAVTLFDGAICISRSVAEELQTWIEGNNIKRERPFEVQWFQLGADTENSAPSAGMPVNANHVLSKLNAHPSFLSVGTIEPRKGYAQILAAFELLWEQGTDFNLVIVGKQGWLVESLVEQINNHVELGKRLFWLEGISDEYLEKVYAASSCLIAASEAEGFGLPLIEAAQHKLPIIARDIPVFREVAGEYAFYFKDSKEPQCIAETVVQWLELNTKAKIAQSNGMPWLTWMQSAEQLIDIVLEDHKLN
jgi:glycosyltransferase involved in cell wall biosynthesis